MLKQISDSKPTKYIIYSFILYTAIFTIISAIFPVTVYGEFSFYFLFSLFILYVVKSKDLVFKKNYWIQKIFNGSLEGVLIVNKKDLKIVYSNKTAKILFNYQEELLLSKNFYDLLDVTYTEKFTSFLEKISIANEEEKMEVKLKNKNGKSFWGIVFVIELDFSVTESFYIFFISDSEKQHQYQLKLKEYYEFLNQAPISILVTDKDGFIKYVNPCVCKSTGYSEVDLLGKHTKIFKSGLTDNAIYESLWQTILSGNVWSGTLQNKKKNGSLRWEQLTVSPITTQDGEIEFLAIKEDIDYKKSVQSKLEYQATHDYITGLYNRQFFENFLSTLLLSSEEDSRQSFLAYLDLDDFKIVNDTVGHSAGDELLRQITLLIKNQVRSTDIFSRLSGDEFGIILENTNLNDVLNLCKRILDTVEIWRFSWNNRIFRLTVSIGVVAVIPNESVTVEQLLTRADQTCYLSKEGGRNKITVYDNKDVDIIEKNLDIINKIRNSLDSNNFILFIQPIRGFNTEEVHLYEVLLRMIDTDFLIINPGSFVPIAERYQLIQEIDKWVVANIFDYIFEHKDTVKNYKFSINLSGKSINIDMANFIIKTAKNKNICCDNIIFEITETASVQNFVVANHFIVTLSDEGFNFALDDFGSGMSSFGYLKQMLVNHVKIDGTFIKGMINNPVDYQIVKAICRILKTMDKKIIAEFVEDEKIYECCKQIGIDYLQGYFIGKPIALSCEFCRRDYCFEECKFYIKDSKILNY